MSIWKKDFDLNKLNNRPSKSMVDFLSIEFTDKKDDSLTARMPVDERTVQPYGILHGGASCVLAETVGSMAAFLCLDPDLYCVGLDINTNHIRSISSGFVYGTAHPYHLGSSTQVWGIVIFDEHDHLIAISRLTMAVLKQKK